MTQAKIDFVNDLVRASIFGIVRISEVEKFINDGVFKLEHDLWSVVHNEENFLPHHCNYTCLVKTPDGVFRCRKLNNLKVSKYNTSHQYMLIPNDYSIKYLNLLDQIGLV